MNFRRFVYLVMNDTKRRDFTLRYIETARLFLPKGESNELMNPPPALEDVSLPLPAARFSPPITNIIDGDMEFMLLGGRGRKSPKVVATDHRGRCLMYDPSRRTTLALPELTAPKFMPAYLSVGDDLYIIDKHFNHGYDRGDCFDGLLYDEEETCWDCYSLPPPPYVHSDTPSCDRVSAHITSYAVVGKGRNDRHSSIWVSKDGLGTHSFDIASHRWAKAGEWVLPFWGPGKYIPEHKLWFDILADEEDGVVCASDLRKAPLTAPSMVWRDNPTPSDWEGKSSFLVHLGHSRFCLAGFFRIMPPGSLTCIKFVVFTGIEVESLNTEEKLRVRKHRSHRYTLENKLTHYVL